MSATLDDISVFGLKKKEIKKITFSTCYSANRDVYSLVEAFSKRMNVKIVVGYSAITVFDYDDNGGTLKATAGTSTS